MESLTVAGIFLSLVQPSLPSGRSATGLAAGEAHTCAILDDGSIYCWGNNGYGRLGNDDSNEGNSGTPVAVSMPTGRTATDIASMKDHTCAIMDDDSLYCWGNGMYGQIGDGTSTNSNLVPTMVDLPAGETTKSVTVGNGHTCAISNTDTLYCWGWNSDSQLGDGSTTNSGTPIDVGATIIPGGTWAIAVEAGGYHTCVILFAETTHCWGDNEKGSWGWPPLIAPH